MAEKSSKRPRLTAWPLPLNNSKLGKLSNYTIGPMPMMFNLEQDKGEAYDVFEKYPETGSRLLEQMKAWDNQMEKNQGGWL